MKEIIAIIVMGAVIIACSGCTSTVTHYDENGKIIKVEEATNFSRAMDGTNEKSQLILIDGTYVGFEASATAGENCTPGVVTKIANGKTAFINAKDNANFKGGADIVEKFFAGKLDVSAAGVKKQ